MNTINTFDEMLKETYQRAKRKGKKVIALPVTTCWCIYTMRCVKPAAQN
jgi:hypothetical protein